jgi:hypothetical protein
VWRYFAWAAAGFLLLTGSVLIWQGSAQEPPVLPADPTAQTSASNEAPSAELRAPEASPKTREQKRFSRADKNKNGRIEREELLAPRRKAFAKLDTNGNGTLQFEEWADKTIDKFGNADRDRSGWLTAAEYATTAPPPPKKKRCVC